MITVSAFGLPADLVGRAPLESYQAPANAQDYQIDLRIINHGLKKYESILSQQLKAVEAIYSQCPGVHLRARVVAREDVKYTEPPEDFYLFNSDGSASYNTQFFKFFEPWKPRANHTEVNVHLIDYFNEKTKQEAKKKNGIGMKWYGQAFNARLMPGRPTSPDVVNSGGDSLVIAMGLTMATDGAWGYMRTPGSTFDHPVYEEGYRTYTNSTLAHELGHLILEAQSASDPIYIDHYCPETRGTCPSMNLMSTGGSPERVYYKPPRFKDVIGYTPLPQLERTQCEILLKSPLVYSVQ